MSPSNNSLKDAWAAVKRHAKEHHDSVNSAYAAYYGAPVQPLVHTPRARAVSPEVSSEPRRSSVDKTWSKVKKHVKEHNQSVNAAYTSYYGINTSRTNTPGTSAQASPRVSIDRS
ncbi:hypothetical protein BKA67DRAFT_536889 [Truncatella angustata]|uniref:Uncharacterized protein n=1 Tax=Truncatella angustata TaxID=152316 RepID=A0A9P8UJL0_9PEZI|nr:uncharacterized protein BKA67DRAFT_536889 [Truncatella angustata]KAH6653195.1 hypothetical protein BKA67DRAFT_536889 [Truncatella angustata]KAH8196757.1 hypothetical protein TruAng_009076 [Truncatella angustata]